MMKMGEAAYQGETNAETDGEADPKADDETVVDAEFEEVDAEADNSKKSVNNFLVNETRAFSRFLNFHVKSGNNEQTRLLRSVGC